MLYVQYNYPCSSSVKYTNVMSHQQFCVSLAVAKDAGLRRMFARREAIAATCSTKVLREIHRMHEGNWRREIPKRMGVIVKRELCFVYFLLFLLLPVHTFVYFSVCKRKERKKIQYSSKLWKKKTLFKRQTQRWQCAERGSGCETHG